MSETSGKRYVLLLGAGTDQRFIIKTAKAMGLGTLVVDGNPNSAGFADADIYGVVSTRDPNAIIAFVEEQQAKGIDVRGASVMGSDIPHILAEVTQHFGWAGPSVETGRIATHKFWMKECFRQHGIPLPAYASVTSPESVLACWQQWACESVIIKPVDQAGSRGVWLIQHDNEIAQAFHHAVENSRSGEVILEEFIPGLQISTESILTQTRCVTPGFADRHYSDTEIFLPQIMENGGWVPSALPNDQQQAVMNLVERSARALGIQRGVAKGDVVICPRRGPMMIEMAARLSGGDFSESMVPLGTGVNYVEAALCIAIGADPDWEKLKPTCCYTMANRYFFVPPGRLEDITGFPQIQALPQVKKLELWRQVGETILPVEHHGARTGVFVLQGENRREVEDLIQQIYQTLQFKVSGHWRAGNPVEYLQQAVKSV